MRNTKEELLNSLILQDLESLQKLLESNGINEEDIIETLSNYYSNEILKVVDILHKYTNNDNILQIAFMSAVKYSQFTVMESLLKKNIYPETKEEALELILQRFSIESASLKAQNSGLFNKFLTQQYKKVYKPAIDMLLSSGVPNEAIDKALLTVTEYNDLDVVYSLIKAGASNNAINESFQIAVKSNHVYVIMSLFTAGANYLKVPPVEKDFHDLFDKIDKFIQNNSLTKGSHSNPKDFFKHLYMCIEEIHKEFPNFSMYLIQRAISCYDHNFAKYSTDERTWKISETNTNIISIDDFLTNMNNIFSYEKTEESIIENELIGFL